MTYPETLEYLYGQLPMFQRIGGAAYKANLDNTVALDNYFNHPHRKFKCIHIAGTNGKGSVSHSLAAVLQVAGYKTGLYTSPHLKDFRERIKINGEKIPEENVVDFVSKHRAGFEPVQPSFFELSVAMAFDFFANEKVELAVIETGMGGRLDSTNIITPVLSVITNISKDHSQFLGDTLEKIAIEKAGIIKPSVPVVIGESQKDTDFVFENKASSSNSPVYFADRRFKLNQTSFFDGKYLQFDIFRENEPLYPELKFDLTGIYQKKNILTILQSIDILHKSGIEIAREHIYTGLESAARLTGLMGRWQILQERPLIICDTAHNEAGIAEIVSQIKTLSYNQLHIVFGMVEDKEIHTILEMLPTNAIYYFCKASIPRALDEHMLMKKAHVFGLEGKCYKSVLEALHAAKENAKPEDFIFVGGSTFVVAELF